MDKIKKQIILLFCLALLLRFAYLGLYIGVFDIEMLDLQNPDFQEYSKVTEYLMGSDTSAENILLFRGPGYPIFIVLTYLIFGHTKLALVCIQVLLSSLAAALTAYITYRLAGKDSKAHIIAGLIAGISLSSMTSAITLFPDSLFHFLLCASVLTYIIGMDAKNTRDIALSGFFAGYAALVKPTGILFPAVLSAAFFFMLRKRPGWGKKAIIIYLLISYGMVSFASIRNLQVHGLFTPATNGVHTALFYWTAAAYANRENVGQSIWTPPSFEVFGTIHPNEGVPIVWGYWKKTTGITRDDRVDNPAGDYVRDLSLIRYALSEFPIMMVATHLKNSILNIFEVDYNYHRLFKKDVTVASIALILTSVSILTVSLTIISLKTFLKTTKPNLALPLLILYLYLILMSGFSFSQGSRLLYPAQISWIPILSIYITSKLRRVR